MRCRPKTHYLAAPYATRSSVLAQDVHLTSCPRTIGAAMNGLPAPRKNHVDWTSCVRCDMGNWADSTMPLARSHNCRENGRRSKANSAQTGSGVHATSAPNAKPMPKAINHLRQRAISAHIIDTAEQPLLLRIVAARSKCAIASKPSQFWTAVRTPTARSVVSCGISSSSTLAAILVHDFLLKSRRTTNCSARLLP